MCGVRRHRPPPDNITDTRIIAIDFKKPVEEVCNYAAVVNAVNIDIKCDGMRAKTMGGASETCPSESRNLFSERDCDRVLLIQNRAVL